MIPYAQKYLSLFTQQKNLCSYDQQQQTDSSRFIEKTCYHCFIQWLFFKPLIYTRKLLTESSLLLGIFPPPSPSLFHSSLLLLLLLSQQQKLILPSFLITTIYICIISRRPSSPHYLIPMQPYSNKTLQISFFLYHAGMRRIAISFVLYPWFVKAPFCLKILLEIKKDHGCTRAL